MSNGASKKMKRPTVVGRPEDRTSDPAKIQRVVADEVLRAAPPLSAESANLCLQLVASMQLSVGDPQFEALAPVALMALKELRALMAQHQMPPEGWPDVPPLLSPEKPPQAEAADQAAAEEALAAASTNGKEA